MANRKNVHVTPRPDGWAVVREGAKRATATTDTQAQAIQQARAIASEEKGELFIHDRENRIRDRNTYGNDPFPPKG